MSETTELLLESIRDELREIRLLLAEPKARRKRHSKFAQRTAALVEQGRAAAVSEAHVQAVVALWHECCPDCPELLVVTDRHRVAIGSILDTMGVDGLRTLFLTVQQNDWLCGRTRHPRRPITLFETISNAAAIINGEYK